MADNKLRVLIIKIGGIIENAGDALINLAIQEYWMQQVSILENICFKFLVIVGVFTDKFNEFSSFK